MVCTTRFKTEKEDGIMNDTEVSDTEVIDTEEIE